MNDPNKRIDVNISSLLSLKAELLRKREEVSKTKQQTPESFVPKKFSSKSSSSNDRHDKIETKNLSDDIDNNRNKNFIEEYEDSSLLDKSRKVLEAKSRFYEKMTASGGSLNSDDNCLVLFNQKKQEDKSDNRRNSMENHHSSDSDDCNSSNDNDDGDDNDYINKNPDEEWVEYTDCLGRTRKCLKKDLEFFKKKDMQLAENIQPRIELNQNAPMWMIDTNGSNITNPSEIGDDVSEMASVMSKHDQMKMNWEKKEEENVYKENVHYQDVLFDEARQHGVGYYAFSTDEEQRAKQRKALDELREKTLTEQKQKESQREQREKIIAERVRAAKNRQRARLGLPPLEDEPEPENKSKPLYDTKEEEKRKRKEEKERRKKEKEEKLREEERKKHIRPWDKNKDGVSGRRKQSSTLSDDSDDDDNKKGKKEEEWKYRREKEPMSQEQWNEMKRNERKQEFAPPPVQSEKQQPKPLRSFRSQPDYGDDSTDWTAHQFTAPETLYFTTMKQKTDSDWNGEQPSSQYQRKEFRKRNYVSSDTSSSSRKDLEKIQEDEEEQYRDKGGGGGDGGVEIPPPATFEYYGPSSSRNKRSKPTQNADLEQSIEAGLKFIRDRSDKGILPVKSSWTANASNTDY